MARGRVAVGCDDGTVGLLDRGFRLSYGFQAHTSSVLFLQHLKLVTRITLEDAQAERWKYTRFIYPKVPGAEAQSSKYLSDVDYYGGFEQDELDALFEAMRSNYKACQCMDYY
ncbi:hypothetical protein C2845_PM09G09800 [Panicum miliaceum]|uniref:Uncharacterized protein n=1 Tax=Panicum miliaceum TaxID=4540 RepID=A0A3L6RZ73_PANMI|nr:hypothetical protein C2845_PM09G09800 [Panicum miliaceum]